MTAVRSVGPEIPHMRNTRHRGAAAILLAINCAFVPMSVSAASESTLPPVHLSPPTVNWSADRLAAYAAAAAAVEAEVERFAARYAQAQGERTKAALIAVNEEAIRAAIRDAGLTLAEFDAIHRAVQGDPRLHARVREIERRD